jgi:two-component system sensor histidine kinase CiaH
MRDGVGRIRIPLGPALRVAMVATLAVAALYTVIVAVLLTIVAQKLTRDTDARVRVQLVEHQQSDAEGDATSAKPAHHDADDAPVYMWRVARDGSVAPVTAGAPQLPTALLTAHTFPRTESVAGSTFRFGEIAGPDGSRLFAAESLAQEQHVRSVLLTGTLIVSPILLAGVFASAFGIGRQASKPVEIARRKQLEFTADASHELRTPLTVIQAEVGLALAADRTVEGYREALRRISDESLRLRKIVEDLLWLARFESEPPPPQTELVDVMSVARQCAERFEPIIRSRGVRLEVDTFGVDPTYIAAAPEWLDRLVGVLLDNAIRYSGPHGQVGIRVESTSGQVALTVADNGPGIAAAEHAKLFDRFHRIDGTTGEGAGLGLAIADAVVRSTNGRWTVGTSSSGGASMTVTWPRPRAHQTEGIHV